MDNTQFSEMKGKNAFYINEKKNYLLNKKVIRKKKSHK
jgi:hypothetical protein